MIDTRAGRNESCPCGSGKKYKKCCLLRQANSPAQVVNVSTRAAIHLADLQKRHPIQSGAGRVEQLFSKMLPNLPPSIQAIHRSGELAVGGTNSPGVLVATHPLGQEFVIEMTFSFMQFIYAVIRTMCGNSSVTNDRREVVKAVLKRDELVQHLSEIANVWKSSVIWERKTYSYPTFPMDAKQIEIAEALTLQAELFVLAHEVGHVLAARSPQECTFPPNYPAPQGEELFADAFATLVTLQIGNRYNPRDAYAGTIFAVRLCAWLERLGYHFGAEYPPAEKRLDNVRGMARFVLSDQVFEFISPIGQALDDQLQAVEDDILGVQAARSESTDAVVVRLRSVVEEIARGRLSRADALKTIAIMLKDVSDQCLAEVGDRLYASCVSLVGNDRPHSTDDIRIKIGKELIAIVPELGDPARANFCRAFKLA